MLNLFLRTIKDKQYFILGWFLGLAFFGFLMMLFFPAFQNSGLDQLLANLPPELKTLKGLLGDLGDLKTTSGYLAAQFFDIRMPMFISVFSVILAIGLSVKDEEDGYLRTLLAMPLSRTKLLFGKLLAIIAICFVAVVAIVAGLWLGAISVGESLDWLVMLDMSIVTLLMSICMTTVVFCIGLASGKRGLTMGLGVLIAAGSFLLTTFAKSVEWLQPYENASLFHYFPAVDMAKNGIRLSDIIVLVSVTIVSVAIAVILFRRRDVH
ncbi:MAG: ABC transporter permease subunit [Candidatus Saccharibacteria bacterium]